MKMGMKTVVIASVLTLALMSGTAMAQMHHTGGGMMNNGMMNNGMMNNGMMNNGMMGNGMMGGQNNWGMGCNGMMGGAMMNQMPPSQQQEFMSQTTELRKQMMEKRFAYMETMRNPDATPQDLAKIEKEMLDLRTKMMDKMSNLQGK